MMCGIESVDWLFCSAFIIDIYWTFFLIIIIVYHHIIVICSSKVAEYLCCHGVDVAAEWRRFW